jgi:para-nitrobenzyl esterase
VALLAGTYLALLAIAAPGAAQEASPTEGPIDVVQVEGGLVQGVETDVPGVQVFKGVPYAGSTAGDNRFKPPQPVESWDGVRKADAWGDQVMQDIHLNPVGGFWGDEFYYDPDFLPQASENGLNLNIFTPASTTEDKLPVYVWIHGGGNDHGYASEIEFWAPKLAEKGIIVVPVQYRVGPFGFMALKELSEESPDGTSGNMALRDLTAALAWVHKNIAGFGGDPANVTVGGQSAGAGNTVTLLRSPEARPFFHRAVIESTATGLLPATFPTLAEQEEADAKALEEVFGKPMTLADLRAVPAEDFLTTKAANSDKSINNALNDVVKKFVIDGVTLTEASVDLLRPGALDGVDIMIGATSDERTSLAGDPNGTLSQEDFAAAMDKAYSDGWQAAYKASDPTHAYRLKLRAETDLRLPGALVSAEMAKDKSDSNVYAYWFNHAPPGRNAEFYGSFHSSDLWYFFDSLRDWPGQRPWTDADYRMADIMSSYLANFVKTGNPNGEGLPEWPQPDEGTAFIRFHDGAAYPVTETPWPSRDALNRAALLKQYGLSDPRQTQ